MLDRKRGDAATCFRPEGDGGNCFRPADDALHAGSVSPCFRPDDDQPAAVAADPGRPVSPCHHPADPDVNSCFHPAEPDVNACFHPGAHATDPNVNACFHPGTQPPVNSCRQASDDLAVDLHLALTGFEERHLAALAGRS